MFLQPPRDVLIVDDAETIRDFLALSLKRAGYQVRVASDGAEAQRAIQESVPYYVISDWQMPHLNGDQLCQWLRQQDLPHYVYFILVTAHDKVFDLVEGLDSGADDYVKKPLNMDELLARLRCGERILTLERRLRVLAVEEATAVVRDLT